MTGGEQERYPADISRRGALALGMVGLVGGCGLQADDTIRPGLDVDAGGGGRPVRYTPPGPQPGDGPEEIIRGFLRAGGTTGPELRVARSFLTDEAAQAWLPDTQTIVHEASEVPKIQSLGGGRYRVSVPVVARIDGAFRYSVAPASNGAFFDFSLREEGDRWVIDGVKQEFGRMLPRPSVERMYSPYAVHYPAYGWNRLVPDLRWITEDQPTTRLASQQLGPVPRYLTGAVQTDEQAKLTVDAVPVVDGAAQVDLDPDVLSTDATKRKQLAAQLVATLMQLPGVSEVALTLDGAPLELADVEPPLTTPEQLGFTSGRTEPKVLVRSERWLLKVPSSGLATLSTADLEGQTSAFAPVPHRWQHLALSTDAKEVAAISDEGTEIARWRDDGSVVAVPTFATELRRPCYDYGGVLWVAGQGVGTQEGSSIFFINARADIQDESATSPSPVPSRWLAGRLVQSFAISPEGSRIAVASAAEGKASMLEVAGISRLRNGLPSSITPTPMQVGNRLVEIRQVTWVSETRLAVIGRTDEQKQVRPQLVDVGGEITPLPQRGGASEIVTVGGERDIVVGDGHDRAWLRTGATWRRLSGVDAVVASTG